MPPSLKKSLSPLLPWAERHRYTPISPNQDSRRWWGDNASKRRVVVAALLLGAAVLALTASYFSQDTSISDINRDGKRGKFATPMSPASAPSMKIDAIGGARDPSEHLLSSSFATAAAATSATPRSEEAARARAPAPPTTTTAGGGGGTTAGSRTTLRTRPTSATPLPAIGGNGADESSEYLLPSAAAAAPELEGHVRVWGGYTSSSSDTDRPDYLVDYPWKHIAEPYRTSVMEVTGEADGGQSLSNGFDFRWEVNGIFVGTGRSVETTFGGPGEYKCTVTAFREQGTQGRSTAAGEPSEILLGKPDVRSSKTPFPSSSASTENSFTFVVTVKYVRREIRSMTDRDRETFFNAVSVIQRVPTAVGRQIYGDKYYSKDYFNRMHLYYGGAADCDHWHDGAGFVTTHVGISLMFEQSLQAVNPSIALPYWDFTIEGTVMDWTNFRDGVVFSDDWFGNAAPRNDLKVPVRGRFAYVPVMTNATEYSSLINPYGLLRSPWNTDSTPFLTRHDGLFGYVNNRKPSGCKQYRDALHQKSWMALTVSLNNGAHGHIHELLGGSWSSSWDAFDERTDSIIMPFLHFLVPLMKSFWRADHLQCPATCAQDMPLADCQCACRTPETPTKDPREVLESSGVLADVISYFYDKNLTLIDNLLDEHGHAFKSIPGHTVDETTDIFSELLHVLCTPMNIGTHYEGTSTNDVTFWVLHPTFDRLWQLRRLMNDVTYEDTWVDDNVCYGHNPTDIQPFHDMFLGEEDDSSAMDESTVDDRGGIAPIKKYYTNEMMYDLLAPDGMNTPYVYDNFEWSHCDAMGIHLHGRATR